MKEKSGEEFLNKVYKNLQESNEVKVSIRLAKKDGKPIKIVNKNDKVKLYMDRLERIYKNALKNINKQKLIKDFFYQKYIIKPENITEEYFNLQKRIALERGYGYLEYTENLKKMEIDQIIEEQKESLDRLLDYFSSEETNYYPMWYKYYAFQSIMKIGYYDKEKEQFTKRTTSTVKPFIELNREALAYVYSELNKLLNNEELDDEMLETLINNGSFNKIYGYVIKKLDSIEKDNIKSDDGIWKKYLQGSDPQILFNDIHGKNTGWCTAGGIETAKTHLSFGDFYVFFTLDKNGEYTNPRIAIRMENSKIAEIRGIGPNQNIEPNMERVVEEKLDEFPDKEEYLKKVSDMKQLTLIHNKSKEKKELSAEELRFLYEIDSKINGFGYKKDPRIKEITNKRNLRNDLSIIFNCNPNQISLSKEEALSGNIIYHYGDLYLSQITDANGLVLPKKMNGKLQLNNLKSAEGLVLPEEINGALWLDRLKSAKGLVLPKKMNGSLRLNSLVSAEDLVLPEELNGDLGLNDLKSAKELILPKKINGYLNLGSLTSIEGLVLPKVIKESLYLNSLTNAEGLVLLKKINGDLSLSNLTSAKGLVLPEEVNGELDLSGLTSTEGLVLPKKINGSLYLDSLTSAEGLVLPEEINGDLILRGLTNINGLVLPKKINGYLDLRGLTSAKGLVLSENQKVRINVSNYTRITSLNLFERIKNKLNFKKLKENNKKIK